MQGIEDAATPSSHALGCSIKSIAGGRGTVSSTLVVCLLPFPSEERRLGRSTSSCIISSRLLLLSYALVSVDRSTSQFCQLFESRTVLVMSAVRQVATDFIDCESACLLPWNTCSLIAFVISVMLGLGLGITSLTLFEAAHAREVRVVACLRGGLLRVLGGLMVARSHFSSLLAVRCACCGF